MRRVTRRDTPGFLPFNCTNSEPGVDGTAAVSSDVEPKVAAVATSPSDIRTDSIIGPAVSIGPAGIGAVVGAAVVGQPVLTQPATQPVGLQRGAASVVPQADLKPAEPARAATAAVPVRSELGADGAIAASAATKPAARTAKPRSAAKSDVRPGPPELPEVLFTPK
jgi:hypothetical protein